MKKLILIRHGKAEDETSGITDFERSLTLKGKIVAGSMAKRLKDKEPSPGLFISSPAFRAYETAMIFAEEFGKNPEEILLNSSLYLRISYQNLHLVLSGVGEQADKITLFGHNPSFSELADTLSKDGFDNLPKTGIVCLSFNVSTWSDVNRNKGKIEYFLIPEK